MRAIHSRNLLIGLSMLAAAALALAMTPRQRIADKRAQIQLESMIPARFGEWKVDETIAPTIFSPEIQANLDRIYSQLLNRTYINLKGERVMLAISYGGDQSYSMQIHRPEVCYPALGFQIGTTSKSFIDAGGAKLPVMRLVATQGSRTEPITYWVMIGDSAVRGNFEQHFARLKYGLTGEIPYGLLIRVSTVSADESQSYRIEEEFLRDMLGAIPMKDRRVLTGAGE